MRLTLSIASGVRSHRRLAWCAGLFCLASLLPLFWVLQNRSEQPRVLHTGVGISHEVPTLPAPWPLSLADTAVRVVEGEFRRGGTLAGVMQRAGVSGQLVDRLADDARPDFDLRQIRAGRPYKIYFDDADQLILFRYQPDRQTAVLVAQGAGGGWNVHRIVLPYEIRPRYLSARVNGSLEGAIASTWVGRRDAIDLARKLADVFAWDIDFAADLRVNDTIEMVVEQRFLENELAGFGDILAAELRIDGLPYRAVRYVRDETPAYFTPTGESLQRSFLRSPVKYTRISSRFTYRRLHPVLNVVRPHLGVDYVAPAGTPVLSTADGVVTFVGRNSQAGNYVKVRHGGSYTSWYLHLSRPAQDLRVGDEVRQGDVVGYVGKTGLVTNYHLDYRLERNGEFVDPLKIVFPAADPLPADEMTAFSAQRDRWIDLLRLGQRQRAIDLAGSG